MVELQTGKGRRQSLLKKGSDNGKREKITSLSLTHTPREKKDQAVNLRNRHKTRDRQSNRGAYRYSDRLTNTRDIEKSKANIEEKAK